MTEPIFEAGYWLDRLETAKELHHSIFKCSLERWRQIETKHREILAKTIKFDDGILDAGCGYGRLLTLMPDEWIGDYFGVDISPDFIGIAKAAFPQRTFTVGDLRLLELPDDSRDLAILISIRPMVIREAGKFIWQQMEKELRRVAKRLLYLEYNPDDNGSVE